MEKDIARIVFGCERWQDTVEDFEDMSVPYAYNVTPSTSHV